MATTHQSPSRFASAVMAAGLLFAGVLSAFLAVVLLLSFSPKARAICGPTCLVARMDQLVEPDTGKIRPGQIAHARRLVTAQLKLSPFDSGAWLRLSILETQAAGRFGDAATRALEASYQLTPVTAELARWRLVFTFDHWREVSPAVRSAAMLEMRSLGVWEANRRMLRGLEPAIQDPGGRLAFHFFVSGLD